VIALLLALAYSPGPCSLRVDLASVRICARRGDWHHALRAAEAVRLLRPGRGADGLVRAVRARRGVLAAADGIDAGAGRLEE
jgi:hypothetical protein